MPPEGRTISTRYAPQTSESAHSAPDPIVYLVGGQGGSARAGIDDFANLFVPSGQTPAVVHPDQRGSQDSSRLHRSLALVDGAREYFDDAEDDRGAEDADTDREPIDARPSAHA